MFLLFLRLRPGYMIVANLTIYAQCLKNVNKLCSLWPSQNPPLSGRHSWSVNAGSDLALRKRVEELLAAHSQSQPARRQPGKMNLPALQSDSISQALSDESVGPGLLDVTNYWNASAKAAAGWSMSQSKPNRCGGDALR